jgi:type I restriction enzyme R subunit
LDYILGLIYENNKKMKDKASLIEDVRRIIRASLGNRAKESLLVDFMNQTDLDQLGERLALLMPSSPLRKLNNNGKHKN